MSIPQRDLIRKIGDTFTLDMLLRWRENPTDPWQPLDLSGVSMLEFSLGVEPGKKTHTYLSTMDPARVWIDTEEVEASPGISAGTYYAIHINIPPSENRTWPKPKQDLPGLPFELTPEYGSPDERHSLLGGYIVIDPEVANETLVTP